MSVKVVLGMGFGDEGKGVVTEYLCSQDPKNTLVIRFSGGHQCGHKVIRDGVEHIFSNFGAGTIVGCPTYWSKYCTFEPVGFIKEYRILDAKWVKPTIYLSPECMVTTPYDIHASHNGAERQHGTTGTGFYRTKKRCANSHLKFTVNELLYCNTQDRKSWMYNIKKYHKAPELELDEFIAARMMIKSLVDKGTVIIAEQPPEYEHIVCEGSQGLMLDPEIGFMPHCTPSDLTPRSVMKMGYNIDEVFLVSRVYQTRHGSGPMTNEGLQPIVLKNTDKETNVTNEYQGVFRTSMLDVNQLTRAKSLGVNQVVPKDTKVTLVVTCTDQLSEYKVTIDNRVFPFGDVEEFVDFLGMMMGINGDIYWNDSPLSSTIKKL